MIKKILIIIFTTYALTTNVIASDDGELTLKKNDPATIEDCSENFNRPTFKFNQALDGLIFKPIASIVAYGAIAYGAWTIWKSE